MITIFTDGSSRNNNKKNIIRIGGIGVYFGENDSRNLSETITENVTNQRTELLACIRALEQVNNCQDKIIIYSDSKYTINCMTKWIHNWSKNNWKKKNGKNILNLELIQQLYKLTKDNDVEFRHLNSHTKEPKKESSNYYLWYGNMMADKLATVASKKL